MCISPNSTLQTRFGFDLWNAAPIGEAPATVYSKRSRVRDGDFVQIDRFRVADKHSQPLLAQGLGLDRYILTDFKMEEKNA